MEDQEVLIEISKLKNNTNALNKRVDELQQITKAFYDLASDVKVMVIEMSYMKKDIKEIKGKVDYHHTEEPNKLMFNIKNVAITGVVSAIVSSVIALIM